MPRFYFHIISETTFLDDVGISFDDDQHALDHARTVAAELVKNLGPARGAVVVENDDTGSLFEVPLTMWKN